MSHQRKITIYAIIFYVCLLLLFFIGTANAATPTTTPTTTPAPGTTTAPAAPGTTGTAPTEGLKLILQQPFSGLAKEMEISGTSIGQYIRALYTFASSAIVALAIVMVIVGGVRWILSAGSPEAIGKAKDTIMKSLLGLFIALFAIFMLQTLSPGTVTFKSITPEGLEGMYCCQVGSDFFQITRAECGSKGGTVVRFEQCYQLVTGNPEETAAKQCNNKDPRAECFAEACDKLTPPRTPSTAGGTCEAEKPNCCAETGPVKTCQSSKDCNETTPPPPIQQYCASAGANQPGRCFDKRAIGANCLENIVGGIHFETWLWLGGGADIVCLSGHCYGTSAAGVNACVPADGKGILNNFCTSTTQCLPELFCACAGFNPSNVKTGPGCTTGLCTQRAHNDAPCTGWIANARSGGCASRCCIGYVLSPDLCKDKAECEASGIPLIW